MQRGKERTQRGDVDWLVASTLAPAPTKRCKTLQTSTSETAVGDVRLRPAETSLYAQPYARSYARRARDSLRDAVRELTYVRDSASRAADRRRRSHSLLADRRATICHGRAVRLRASASRKGLHANKRHTARSASCLLARRAETTARRHISCAPPVEQRANTGEGRGTSSSCSVKDARLRVRRLSLSSAAAWRGSVQSRVPVRGGPVPWSKLRRRLAAGQGGEARCQRPDASSTSRDLHTDQSSTEALRIAAARSRSSADTNT